MFLCLPFLSLSLSIASFRFARFIPLSPSTFFLSGSFLPPFVPLTFHGFSFFFFFSTVVFSRERFFRPGTRACSLFWFVVFLPTAWYLRTCITRPRWRINPALKGVSTESMSPFDLLETEIRGKEV